MEIVGGRLGSCPKTFLRGCGETATPQARDCKSACQDNRIYYREQAVTLFSANLQGALCGSRWKSKGGGYIASGLPFVRQGVVRLEPEPGR